MACLAHLETWETQVQVDRLESQAHPVLRVAKGLSVPKVQWVFKVRGVQMDYQDQVVNQANRGQQDRMVMLVRKAQGVMSVLRVFRELQDRGGYPESLACLELWD